MTPEEERERSERKEKYKTGCLCECHSTDDCECYSHAPCVRCDADLPGLCKNRPAAPIRPSNAQIDAEFQRRQEYRQFKDLKR